MLEVKPWLRVLVRSAVRGARLLLGLARYGSVGPPSHLLTSWRRRRADAIFSAESLGERLALVAGEVEVSKPGWVGDTELAARAFGKPPGVHPHHADGVWVSEDLERCSCLGVSK